MDGLMCLCGSRIGVAMVVVGRRRSIFISQSPFYGAILVVVNASCTRVCFIQIEPRELYAEREGCDATRESCVPRV
jgi:hypothetical protein